jgi:hypothetical protein
MSDAKPDQPFTNGMIVHDGRLYAMLDGMPMVMRDGQFYPLMVRRPSGLAGFNTGDEAFKDMLRVLSGIAPDAEPVSIKKALGQLLGVLILNTPRFVHPWNAAIMEAYRQRAEAAETALAAAEAALAELTKANP